MCGLVRERQANATRDFWPPERRAIFWRPVVPVMPKAPRWRRYSSSVLPGNIFAQKATALEFRSRASTWCWAKKPIRRRGFWVILEISLGLFSLYKTRVDRSPTVRLTGQAGQ